MATANEKIKAVLEAHDEDFTEGPGNNVWRVQGTPVISHKTLERIAGRAGIVFDLPTVLRCERDEAVILVAGKLGERREWSIGEALVNVNYRVSGKQAAYVYAMAEKRAKDRVILKLIELHGLAYSENEADEFSGTQQPTPDPADEEARRFISDCERAIDATDNRDTLVGWWNGDERKAGFRKHKLTEDEGRALADRVKARADALGPGSRAAA